ncbi:hypothetical protein LSAT2_012909 [Lamellibrachia satsuma]|nr:hypothetical protein LSAT2_012909 [Lamellibrachia satsuma]
MCVSTRRLLRPLCLSPKVTTTPDLKVLPRTTEAFEQNVRRAHIQTALWKLTGCPGGTTNFGPTKYCWARDEASKPLIPIMLPLNVTLAPSEACPPNSSSCSRKRVAVILHANTDHQKSQVNHQSIRNSAYVGEVHDVATAIGMLR